MQFIRPTPNTNLLYPISKVNRLHLTVPLPILPPDINQWLDESGIDKDSVFIQLYLAFTPEGIEEEYFDVFHKHAKHCGWLPGDATYGHYRRALEVAEQILKITMAQYIYTQAFEYVIRGEVVNIQIINNTALITVEYGED